MRVELAQLSARHPAAARAAAPALQDIDLAIAPGEQVAVIGPSGAGKTSLLHVLACALPPAAGRLLLDGVEPWRLPRRALQALRGRLVLAPQVAPLPPRQRVVTAVLAGRLPAMSLAASVRSLVRPAGIAAAHAALDRFDLAGKLFERVDRLSEGERQRVGLARALLAPAELWLVDEPLSALDPARSRQALAALVETARERGVTLVTTLHDVPAARSSFARLVGLRAGRVVFDLPAAEVTQERLDRLYAPLEPPVPGVVDLLPPAPGAVDLLPPAPAAAPLAPRAPLASRCQ